MAIEMSVADYANNPKFHKKEQPVPKPTVFKQIREGRLPAGVSARKVGDRYIMTILEPGETFTLVGYDLKDKDREIVLLAGEQGQLLEFARVINALAKYAPVKVVPSKV